MENLINSEEIENLLIGHILSSRKLFNRALSLIDTRLFTYPTTAAIWDLCTKYDDITSVPSAAYLSIELNKKGIKINSATINKWKIVSQTTASFEHQYESLAELLRHRELYKIALEISEKANDLILDARSTSMVAIHQLEQINSIGGTIEPLEHEIHSTVSEIFQAADGKSRNTISLGLNNLDTALSGGYERGTLNIIGARSGMGKTAFSMWLAATIQKRGVKCGFVSMEMTRSQMNRRELSIITSIPYQRLKKGYISAQERPELVKAASEIESNSFEREYTGAIDTNQLRAVLSRMKYEKECELIVIDYLQIMKMVESKGNRANALGDIVNELKAIAVRMEICIVLLCQINRESMKSDNKEPQIYHLKDSGSIEEAADTVILLHRPEVYDKDAVDPNGVSFRDRIGFFIEKNRDGDAQVVIYTYCNMSTNQFYNEKPPMIYGELPTTSIQPNIKAEYQDTPF